MPDYRTTPQIQRKQPFAMAFDLNFVILIAGLFLTAASQTLQGDSALVKPQQAIGSKFEGCYTDKFKSLTTSGNYHQRIPGNANSICIKICAEKGYAIVATKGADCFCSNSLPVPALHFSRDPKASGNGGPCNTVCPGAFTFGNCKGDECCGGPNAYSVYIVDSIDILKELVNRIAVNFKNNKETMHKRILTLNEISTLNCQCFQGEVTIYLKAKRVSKDGEESTRTVKAVIDIGNTHHTNDVGENEAKDLRKVELVLGSIEKLLETEEPVREKPFGKWDLLCDNYFGGSDQVCTKTFSESAGFQKTISTEHGVSTSVKHGGEVGNDFFKRVFEIDYARSFTKGYSETTTEEKSEGFEISITAPKGTKGEVRFFTSDIPVKVKWRANFFADGDVLIDYGGVGIKKSVHLSRLLTYDQRKVFAFGTIDYGERPTIIARTRTVDRQGRIVSEKDSTK